MVTVTLRSSLTHASPFPLQWITHLDELQGLKQFIDDKNFLRQVQTAKRENKMRLAAYVKEHYGLDISIDALFDCQVLAKHSKPSAGNGTYSEGDLG